MSGATNMYSVTCNCPNCNYLFRAEDFVKQIKNSEHDVIHKKCKGCNEWVGIYIEYKAIPITWMKKDPKKMIKGDKS